MEGSGEVSNVVQITSRRREETRSGVRGDWLTELFAPDTTLPAQFFSGPRRDSYISGEKALMLAILEDSIRCFQGDASGPHVTPAKKIRAAEEAEDWIRADDYEWPFSFVNVCETLEVDPSALRRVLLDWKAKHLAESDGTGGPIPTTKKVYRLHLRTKRAATMR